MGNNYNLGWSKHPNLRRDQTRNHTQNGAPQPRKSSPLDELLNKFANISKTNFDYIQATVANQGATIKSFETHIGQLSKLVTTHVSKDIGDNTVDNPMEESNALKEKEIERAEDEEVILQFKKWFNQLGITLEEAYDEFNVMPLSLAKGFKLKEPTVGTDKELVMADQTTVHSRGTIEDVLVKNKDLVFPADSMIRDIEEDEAHPIILGRPFLSTSRAIIDMDLEELTLIREDQQRLIKIHKENNEECCKLEWKEKKEATPPTPAKTWRVKIELKELEDEMVQQNIDTSKVKDELDELTNQMQRLAIKADIKALWVKAWGRYHKTAIRSKFGVNTAPLKKTAADGLKLRFNRIDKEKDRRVNVPRKLKEGKPPQKKVNQIMGSFALPPSKNSEPREIW
ncbi:hypothetical protein QL285_004517 [Trifolium repens]|nr:hypothetical protein QL285_004517 [Trifolium repens]